MTDRRDELRLSTDAAEMDLDAIHAYLSGESYRARVTKDAQGLYAPFGFAPVAHPERHRERTDPGICARVAETGSEGELRRIPMDAVQSALQSE